MTRASSFYRGNLIGPKLLNFFTFLYQYSFYSFRSNFLKEYFKMSMDQVAFVFFFVALGSFIGMSSWAYVSDKTRQPKLVFSFVVIASLLSFYGMYFQDYIMSHSYKCTIVAALMSLFSFFNFGMNPILSSVVLEMLNREGITDKAVYGRQVAFGSIAFIVANLVLGQFKGASAAFPVLAVTGLMLFAVVFFVFPNDIDPSAAKKTEEKMQPKENVVSPPWYCLLMNPKFMTFLTVIFLTGCARSFMSVYLTVYYKDSVLLSNVQSSMLLVSGILFELVGFWFSTSVSRIGPYRMLVVAQFFMVARCWAYYLIPGEKGYFALFLFVELMKGAAFGLTHLAGVKVARESAPEGLEATAQAFYEGCYSQLPSLISVPLGGPAIKDLGFTATFLITALGISFSFVTVTSIFAFSGNLSRPN